MTEIILLARPATGGIRTHVAELARLPRKQWNVTLAAPEALIASMPRGLPPYQPLAVPVAARPSLSDFRAASILRELVRLSASPPIVHAHGIRAGFVAALASRGISFPLVVTLHNVPPKSILGRIALSFICRRARATIAVSKAIADTLPATCGPTVIPNGIDLAAYGGLDRTAARRELGLAPDRIAVVCASRLSAEKGVDVLVRAAAATPRCDFLVAGDGSQREALARMAGANVRLLGRIGSVPELLAAADIAAVPSLTEGQGIFALEAMAAGCAIAASNVGGLPEMIEDDVTGMLVPPADPAALAAALTRLAGDAGLRARLGVAAQRRAAEIGDIARMVERTEAVYRAAGA